MTFIKLYDIQIKYLIYSLVFCFSISILSAKEDTKRFTRDISKIKNIDLSNSYYNLFKKYSSNNFTKAKYYADLCLINHKLDNKVNKLLTVYKFLANFYENISFEYSKAINYQKFINRISIKHQIKDVYFQSSLKLSRLYIYLLKYDIAYQYLDKCSKDKDCIDSEKNLLEIYTLYGYIYNNCRDYANAELKFQALFDLARKSNNIEKQAVALNNFAVIKNVNNDIKNARILLKECIDLCVVNKVNKNLCQYYLNIANTYIGTNNPNKVNSYLRKAKTFCKNIKQKGSYFSTLGICYFQLYKNYDKAIQFFNKSLYYYTRGEFLYQELQIYSYLHQIYSLKKEYPKAYRALLQYKRLEEKLSQQESRLKVVNIERKLEKEQTKSLLANAEKNLGTMLWLIIISIIILLSLLYYFCTCRDKLLKSKEIEFKNYLLNKEKIEVELKAKNEILKLKELQEHQYSNLIDKLIDSLSVVSCNIKNPEARKEIIKIINKLQTFKHQGDNTELEDLLSENSSLYFKNLLNDFPNLTLNERRLCLLLHMNMTTKEISRITNQSVKSINVARSRLRKKLGMVGSDESLTSFLDKYN